MKGTKMGNDLFVNASAYFETKLAGVTTDGCLNPAGKNI